MHRAPEGEMVGGNSTLTRQLGVWATCTGALLTVAAFNRARGAFSRSKTPRIKLVEEDGRGFVYLVFTAESDNVQEPHVAARRVPVATKEEARAFIDSIPAKDIRWGDRLFLRLEARIAANLLHTERAAQPRDMRPWGWRASSGLP